MRILLKEWNDKFFHLINKNLNILDVVKESFLIRRIRDIGLEIDKDNANKNIEDTLTDDRKKELELLEIDKQYEIDSLRMNIDTYKELILESKIEGLKIKLDIFKQTNRELNKKEIEQTKQLISQLENDKKYLERLILEDKTRKLSKYIIEVALNKLKHLSPSQNLLVKGEDSPTSYITYLTPYKRNAKKTVTENIQLDKRKSKKRRKKILLWGLGSIANVGLSLSAVIIPCVYPFQICNWYCY
ncbi:DgyrCDS2446 [Dimorphilus gyrociliatus]|uniref:DgyrCDS2446 n=1 Tax=Dimorphilus gyrociliatus TaxID=2664684 RepID=A0A7I8VD39_9ANNE|nr:DgyrCDS2446 [Dimorphilus gyrociliatus]